MNTSFSITKEQLISVLKGFLIAEAGALLTTAAIWVSSGSLDIHSLLVLEGAAMISTATNFLRKFLPNTTQ